MHFGSSRFSKFPTTHPYLQALEADVQNLVRKPCTTTWKLLQFTPSAALLPLLQAPLTAIQRGILLTRPFMERLPVGRFDYRPHAKSMTLGQLASHLADMLGNIEDTLATDLYDMATAPVSNRPARATSPAQLIARLTPTQSRRAPPWPLPTR